MRLAILALTSAALLGAASAADEPTAITCAGPFGKDSSEEFLKKAFGAENVVYKTVPGPEGTEMNASVVFPNDPARMVTVNWWNEEERSHPSNIGVVMAVPDDAATPADYFKTEILNTSPQGVKIGATIEDVQALNGKPFKISGFEWDYGGFAVNWEGGKLATPEGSDCHLMVRFMATSDSTPEGAMGDVELASDVLAAKPRVSEFAIGYPAAEPH
jgi:hypothetical protein